MTYYFAKTLEGGFNDAVRRYNRSPEAEGFGIITEIDVKDTLKKKIHTEFRNYRIFGACNPTLAYEALQLENKVGTMLPCNVVVQDTGNGKRLFGKSREGIPSWGSVLISSSGCGHEQSRGRMAEIAKKTKRYPSDLTDEEWAGSRR